MGNGSVESQHSALESPSGEVNSSDLTGNLGIDLSSPYGTVNGANAVNRYWAGKLHEVTESLGSDKVKLAAAALGAGGTRIHPEAEHAIRIRPLPLKDYESESAIKVRPVPTNHRETEPAIIIRPITNYDEIHIDPLRPKLGRDSDPLLKPLSGTFVCTAWTKLGRLSAEKPPIQRLTPNGVDGAFLLPETHSLIYNGEQLAKFSIHDRPHVPASAPSYETPAGARVWKGSSGLAEHIKTATGQVFEFSYDRYGKLRETHEPDGSVVSKDNMSGPDSWIRTNSEGKVTRLKGDIIARADGSVEYKLRYDTAGQTHTTWNGNGAISEVKLIGEGTYLNERQLLSVVDQDGNRASFHYDRDGLLDEVNYKDTRFVFNGRGWTRFESDGRPQPLSDSAVSRWGDAVAVEMKDGKYIKFDPQGISGPHAVQRDPSGKIY